MILLLYNLYRLSCCYCGRNYIPDIVLFLPRENFWLGPGQINDLPLKTPGILLPSVGDYHVTRMCYACDSFSATYPMNFMLLPSRMS